MSTVTAPSLGEELTKRAEGRKKFLAQQEVERTAFIEVLQTTCQAHRAQPGKPCWQLGDSSRGVCGPRISNDW